jgi:hypothetical protein
MKRIKILLLALFCLATFGLSDLAYAGEQRSRGSRKAREPQKRAQPAKPERKASSSRKAQKKTTERRTRSRVVESRSDSKDTRARQNKAKPTPRSTPSRKAMPQPQRRNDQAKPRAYSQSSRSVSPERKAVPRSRDREVRREVPDTRSRSVEPRRTEPSPKRTTPAESRTTYRSSRSTTGSSVDRSRTRSRSERTDYRDTRDRQDREYDRRGSVTTVTPRSRDDHSTASRRDTGRSSSRTVARKGRYSKEITVRSRSGSFDYKRHDRARRDRDYVGRISFRYRADDRNRSGSYVRSKSGRYARYTWAKHDYIRNDFRLVSWRDRHCYINRDYLIGGRWGSAPHRYNGRNWHFYLSLTDAGFSFDVGYGGWGRRYYGDTWDVRFGWSSSAYLPSGYYSKGTYYYEPNYAFSFTFNHGYENGYIEGFNKGTSDWNRNYPYNSSHYGVVGYFSDLGPYYEFADGFEQGFIQGYYAAYSGMPYGWENFGYGDFRNYPVIYDFDYDYYNRQNGYYYSSYR